MLSVFLVLRLVPCDFVTEVFVLGSKIAESCGKIFDVVVVRRTSSSLLRPVRRGSYVGLQLLTEIVAPLRRFLHWLRGPTGRSVVVTIRSPRNKLVLDLG